MKKSVVIDKSIRKFFRNKTVLVCGGSGFIGSNLLIKLLHSGAKIRATYHIRKPQVLNKNIRYIKADLTHSADCKKLVKGVDFVFMCAANTSGAKVIDNNPLSHVTPNVIMNTLILDAAYNAGVKKFLFISSNTVYPPYAHAVKEDEAFKADPYYKYFPVAWMKRYGEILCETYTSKIKSPMTCVVIRPANSYGPFDDFDWETSHVVPSLIRKAVERHKPIEVWGNGLEIKDLIYVEDLVEGMLKAFIKIDGFLPINIGTGKTISIRQILKLILQTEQYKGAKVSYNLKQPTMIKKRVLSIELSQRKLGFKPKTSIAEGLARTIDWYKLNKKTNGKIS